MCKVKQTSEYMLLSCRIYKAEQRALKNAVLQIKSEREAEQNSELSLKRLLCTEKEIKNTLAYLNQTKVATRKWILEKIEGEEKLKRENIDRVI